MSSNIEKYQGSEELLEKVHAFAYQDVKKAISVFPWKF